MYRRILVPLDGSTTAEQALPLAIGVARRMAATLRLVHANDFGGRLPADADDPNSWRGCAEDDAETYLQRIAGELRFNPGTMVHTSVRNGEAAPSILQDAADWDADLIVMTTHGRGMVERAWLGSVADAIVRGSGLPVLLVRAQKDTPRVQGSTAIKHILVPLDGWSEAKRVLGPAVALARAFDARLTLLHIVHPWVKPVRPLAHAHHAAEIREQAVTARTEDAEQ